MMLITGGTGQLGSALRQLVPAAMAPGRSELDLARPDALRPALARLQPDAIINCAGYTAVDRAEAEEDLAMTVNCEAVGVLATYSADANIPFVTFSSDYVFDGTSTTPYVESDAPGPLNAYGRSKLAGERAALEAHPDALVVRTAWVISGTHPNFVATVLRVLAERGAMDVVADQTGSPTLADDLGRAVLDALDAGVSGLLHLTNEGETSWHGVAQEVARLAAHDPAAVKSITSDEYGAAAVRPEYSVLSSERRASFGIPALPHWKDALRRVVSMLQELA